MSKLKEKQAEFEQAKRDATTFYSDAEAAKKAGDTAKYDSNIASWRKAMDDTRSIKSDIALLTEMEGFDSKGIKRDEAPEPKPKSGGDHKNSNPDDGDDALFDFRPWGKSVVKSEAFTGRANPETDPIRMKVGAFAPLVNRKAIYGAVDAQGGYFVEPQRLPLVDRRNPTLDNQSLLELLDTQPVGTDSVEFIIDNGVETNNAAVVPEYASGNFGLKPESDFSVGFGTATIKTIATYIRASRQILADAPRLRAMIDNRLTRFVRTTLEAQVVAGDGTGNNFLGLLNTTGTLAREHRDTANRGLADDTIADTLKRAITDLSIEGYEPDVILVHPYVAEELELLKDGNKQYLQIYDEVSQNIWRVPVKANIRIPVGVAIVGNLSVAATLFDRQQVEIRVGEPGDLFLRNAVAILAELRAGFAVTVPKALVFVDLIPD